MESGIGGRKKSRSRPAVFGMDVRQYQWDGEKLALYSDVTLFNALVNSPYKSEISYETPNFNRFGNCVQTSDVITAHNVMAPWKYTFWQWDGEKYIPWRMYNGYGVGLVEYQVTGNRGPIYPGSDLPEHQEIYLDDWSVDSTCEEGFKAITPDVESDISLINLLLELKDLKSLVTGPVQIARRLMSDIGQGKIARGLLRASGNIILQDAYVNKTTLSDAIQLYTTLSTLKERVDSIWEAQGKAHSGHWSSTRAASVTIKEKDPFVNEGYWRWYRPSWVTTKESRFTCTLRYRYRLKSALGVPFANKADFERVFHLEKLGVSLNPRIIWDAIPFSFVVDWFANVGDVLENAKLDNFGYDVIVEDACYSIKTVTRSDYITRRTGQAYHGGPKDGVFKQIAYAHYSRETKDYLRKRILPRREWLGSGSATLETGLPNPVQWVRGAALLFSR